MHRMTAFMSTNKGSQKRSFILQSRGLDPKPTLSLVWLSINL